MDEIEKKDLILTIDGKPVGKVTKSLALSATFQSLDIDDSDTLKKLNAAKEETRKLQERFDKEFTADQQQGIRECMIVLADVVLSVGASSLTQYATTVDGTKTMIKVEVIKEGEFGWMEEPKQ